MGYLPCKVGHQVGELGSERTFLLFAFTGPSLTQTAPSFSSVLKDSVVIEGQDFVLRCSVRGTPAPQVTWLLNGEFPLLLSLWLT